MLYVLALLFVVGLVKWACTLDHRSMHIDIETPPARSYAPYPFEIRAFESFGHPEVLVAPPLALPSTEDIDAGEDFSYAGYTREDAKRDRELRKRG